jgi:hypothetical protein
VGTPQVQASVGEAVEKLRALYGFAGSLNQAEARALIERRRTATAAIVARLANTNGAGIQGIGDAYRSAESGKEKLMLIEALRENPDPAAPTMMAELYASEESFSYRRALIEGVGGSSAPNAAEVAATFASEATDARERVSAIKALPMTEESVSALVARVETDADLSVRISAVGRLSKIGGEAAFAALGKVVGAADDPVRLRAAAVQAIARTYPSQALATLDPLAQDPNVRVRAAVVRALEQIKTDGAVQLLRVLARDDTDASIRSSAAMALTRVTL